MPGIGFMYTQTSFNPGRNISLFFFAILYFSDIVGFPSTYGYVLNLPKYTTNPHERSASKLSAEWPPSVYRAATERLPSKFARWSLGRQLARPLLAERSWGLVVYWITGSIPHFIFNVYMGFILSLGCLIPRGLDKSNKRSLKIDL